MQKNTNLNVVLESMPCQATELQITNNKKKTIYMREKRTIKKQDP